MAPDHDSITDHPPAEKRPISAYIWPTVILTVVIPFIIYALTAFRSINWWDNSEYSLAAICLGVPHPPGSLLATILGWLFTKLPLGIASISKLNLFASLQAALTAAMICWLSIKLWPRKNDTASPSSGTPPYLLGLGGLLGGLIFAFTRTEWTYAIQFTPYILTPLFTALIIWAACRWWEKAENDRADEWLFVIALLIGLDFSVHRTNLLLLPGLFFWILIRRKKTCISGKSWMYGTAGVLCGLALQLLLIPLALRDPFLNMNNPSSLGSLWDYLSLKMYGGNWLVDLYPRKAPLISYQVVDYWKAFANCFFHADGHPAWFGFLPTLLGLWGMIRLCKNDGRRGIALIILFLLTVAFTIFYFNIPGGFFRPFDRHYLPTFVIFAVFIGLGASDLLTRLSKLKPSLRPAALAAAVVLLLIIPLSQITRNYRALDGSQSTFSRDFAANLLSELPPDAILFVAGDNDTYPLLFVQYDENLRRDVTVLNVNLLNTEWDIKQIIRRDSTFPLTMDTLDPYGLRPRPWRDTTIYLSGDRDPARYRLPGNPVLPDSIPLHIPPSVNNTHILPFEWIMLNIVRENKWIRPIYFSLTVPENVAAWIRPCFRMEGLVYRVVPAPEGGINLDILSENLLSRYLFRGFDNPNIPLEDQTRWIAWNYYQIFLTLGFAEMNRGNMAECAKIKNRILTLLPPDRLAPPPQLARALESLCPEQTQNK